MSDCSNCRSSPPRATVGFATRLSEVFLGALNRLFRKRHPGNFDAEYGSWQAPDINITPGTGLNVPRPLINRGCKTGILVYCYVSNPTPRCSFLGQLAALNQAIDQVAAYLRDDYRCENRNCLQEVGELVWFGFGCSRVLGLSDYAGVLVRFRCVPEL